LKIGWRPGDHRFLDRSNARVEEILLEDVEGGISPFGPSKSNCQSVKGLECEVGPDK
jgi:hypothetical protein